MITNWPSINRLQSEVTYFFLRKSLTPIFIGDQCNLVWTESEVADVVLFGDALARLSQFRHWQKYPKYRLWCLSPFFKRLVSNFFDIPPALIGVVPEDHFDHPKEKSRPWPAFDQPISFVYSGRITAGKNPLLLQALGKQLLQMPWGQDVNFYYCGVGLCEDFVNRKIQPQTWAKKPVILGDLGEGWYRYPFRNPVFINLSTDWNDDYGICVREAIGLGWPTILSEWGGWAHFSKRNSIILNPAQFALWDSHSEELDLRAERIFHFLDLRSKAGRFSNIDRSDKKIKFEMPETMSHKELSKKVDLVLKSAPNKLEILKTVEAKNYDLKKTAVIDACHFFSRV